MDNRAMIEFAVGAFFVTLYAYSRFTNTRKEEHLAVNSRYFFALGVYILLSIFAYFLLSFVITAGIALPFLGIDSLLENIRNAFSEKHQILSAQLLSALLLTEALPRIKKAADADNELRILFQRMASLSSTAQSLSSKFQHEPLKLHDENFKELVDSFAAQELDQKDIQIEYLIENTSKPRHTWTRISLLWNSLNKWKNQPEFRIFFNCHSSRFENIKNEYASLAGKVKYCFKLSDAGENDPELKRALQDCANHYAMQLKKHLQKVADFMSCALLNSKKGNAQASAISQMGFKAEYNQGLSVDLLTLMFIVILFILLVGFGFTQWASNPKNGLLLLSPERFIRAIMIASIYSIGIVCAIMAKKRSDQKGNISHAWATYFLMALFAGLMSSLVSIFTNTIMSSWNLNHGFTVFSTGINGHPAKWPWQLMVFSTTFFTAYLLNQKEVHKISVAKLRYKEASIMSAAILVSFLVAGSLMRFTIAQFLSKGFIALAVGFSIGYFIPTWYRGAPKQNKKQIVNKIEYAEMSS